MGANAQTTVPLFVANTVLTAATQNISAATGVPVFATTVTRDAAFGGANKALAEGQLCYIEASDVVQYYTGAAWATVGPASAGGLVPIYSETAFSGVTTITRDNIFTSTYTNYLIVLRYEITGAAVSMQLRVGGVTAATNYNRDLLEWASGASSVSTLTAQTSLGIGGATAGNVGLVNMFVSGPALAASTIFQPYNTYFSTVGVGALYNGRHSTATAYDGFIITGGANMSGTYTIYGYGKTA